MIRMFSPGLQPIYDPLGGQNRIDDTSFNYIFHKIGEWTTAFFLRNRQSALRLYLFHPSAPSVPIPVSSTPQVRCPKWWAALAKSRSIGNCPLGVARTSSAVGPSCELSTLSALNVEPMYTLPGTRGHTEVTGTTSRGLIWLKYEQNGTRIRG